MLSLVYCMFPAPTTVPGTGAFNSSSTERVAGHPVAIVICGEEQQAFSASCDSCPPLVKSVRQCHSLCLRFTWRRGSRKSRVWRGHSGAGVWTAAWPRAPVRSPAGPLAHAGKVCVCRGSLQASAPDCGSDKHSYPWATLRASAGLT